MNIIEKFGTIYYLQAKQRQKNCEIEIHDVFLQVYISWEDKKTRQMQE